MNKADLVITAIQQRIGEITSNYEIQVALLRAELTEQAQQLEERQKTIEHYAILLAEKTSTSKQKSKSSSS